MSLSEAAAALNDQQRAFADEWLTGAATGKQFNAYAAAQHAGYSTPASNPYVTGSGLLRNEKIRAYLKEQMDEIAMGVEEVLGRYANIARTQIGDMVELTPSGHDVRLNLPELMASGRHMIKGIGVDSNGNTKIDFHDSMAAMGQIARILGLTKDGIHIGAGGPVEINVNFVSPDTE